jgi:hypothetical protein
MLAEIRSFSSFDHAAREQLHRRVETMIASGILPKPLQREVNSSELVREQIHREIINTNIDPLWEEKFIEIPPLKKTPRSPRRIATPAR